MKLRLFEWEDEGVLVSGTWIKSNELNTVLMQIVDNSASQAPAILFLCTLSDEEENR